MTSQFSVKYWTGNHWETFDTYGANYEPKAREIANKLAGLFSSVEIHFYQPGKELEIERIS